MFRHNFWYSLKILFCIFALIFWTFAFPLILGTFFYMAFRDIEKNEKLGKKLFITGKGRCNITSSVDMDDFIKNVPR